MESRNNDQVQGRAYNPWMNRPFGALEELSGKAPWAVFPRKRLDITYSDIMYGLSSCVCERESNRAILEHKIEELWEASQPTEPYDSIPHRSSSTMVCLSVRTGFDLLLQSLEWPQGSEILCSAITIPDMIYLIKYHGLIPVPVDLEKDSCKMNPNLLHSMITKKTKAILIAHVFGTRNSLTEITKFAKEHNLLVIEDCAQAFTGLEFVGSKDVDATMFSFGTIKTSTALGGAIIRVKDVDILEKMRRKNSQYVPRSKMFFFTRLVKYAIVHGLSTPALFGLFVNACTLLQADPNAVITNAIRGFSGSELASLIRKRPSIPLLSLLYHRLSNRDNAYVRARRERSELLGSMIKDVKGSTIPGELAAEHHYWLYPVLVPNPLMVAKLMTKDGYDVTSGATQLTYVQSNPMESNSPEIAKAIITQLVYLPVTPEMPLSAVEGLAKSFRSAVQAATPRPSRL